MIQKYTRNLLFALPSIDFVIIFEILVKITKICPLTQCEGISEEMSLSYLTIKC